MKRVRVGLVGAGFAAEYQVECFRRVYGAQVELAGVTSPTANRDRFGARHGITAYDDLAAMLPHVDLVSICSPPAAHEDALLLAAQAGKAIVCEKPLTGFFGPMHGDDSFHGNQHSKQAMLEAVIKRLAVIRRAIEQAGVFFGYAENFIYAPSVQKEREILEKTGAQILRMMGEESHNGSASSVYGIWSCAGGGSLIGKGVHPLGGMLYLKRVEGIARNGRPIRPQTVSSRVAELTRLPAYQDKQLIRTDYRDIEDYGWMHVRFEDGTVADVVTSEVVLGGIYDYIEVFANNHRSRCRISPVGMLDTYNPVDEAFKDVYLIEKASTQAGWTPVAPDDKISMGYQAEFQDFIAAFVAGREPYSGLELALDTTAAVYAAYLSAENAGAETRIPRI